MLISCMAYWVLLNFLIVFSKVYDFSKVTSRWNFWSIDWLTVTFGPSLQPKKNLRHEKLKKNKTVKSIHYLLHWKPKTMYCSTVVIIFLRLFFYGNYYFEETLQKYFLQ